MKNMKVTYLTQAAMIAAIYVVLTVFVSALNLASGAIQIRISEAMCILPFFTPAAIPGLWLGCFIANWITGCAVFDIVFGSIATLIGALGTYYLRSHSFLCTLPPVLSNIVIVPLVLHFGYGLTFTYHGVNLAIPFFALTVGIGEVISVCILGSILLHTLLRYRNLFLGQKL